MERKLISLLIVACMVFALLPVSAFAAQSYGIYVGGVEVTTANYKNITGKGISGKVSYDPQNNQLTLENATITGSFDLDPSIGDHYALVSFQQYFYINIIGNCTIDPAKSGTNLEYVTAIAGAHVSINGENQTLTVNANHGKNNIGIFAEYIGSAWCELNIHAGDTASGSSYGIYASGEISFPYVAKIHVSSGNAPMGESIAMYSEGPLYACCAFAPISIRSGNAGFSCAVYGETRCGIEGNGSISSGTAYEYDSIAVFSPGYVNLCDWMDQLYITSGASEKGSSFAAYSDTSVRVLNVTAQTGNAANSSSIVFYSGGTFKGENVRVSAGSGMESAGIAAAGDITFVSGTNNYIRAGSSSEYESVGIYTDGSVTIPDCSIEVFGMDVGVHAAKGVTFSDTGNISATFSGAEHAVSEEITFQGSDFYWTANAESTIPTRNYQDNSTVPLEEPQQYRYLRIIDGDKILPTPFDDVPKDAYYVDPVLWAVDNGITQGTGPITFSPEDTCTRAQTVTFLWRNAGCPEPETTEMPFTDVAETDYFYHAVLWAVENGITVGATETTFEPESTVTRAQVVTFMWRQQGCPDMGQDDAFADVPDTEYYYDAVLWAVKTGITVGTGAGKFSPDDGCIRAQIVTFLHRMFLNQPLSCDYASEEILSGEYGEVILTDSEDPVLVSFSVREAVTHVEITSMVLTEEGMEPEEVLYTQDELTPELLLVAHLEFPGDFSCYGFSFTDAKGDIRSYIISISGRDGSLVAQEEFT